MDFNSGGKKAIERLVEAYGFGTRQALCDHLGVSKSTMATRYMRDIFPADWVIQCALETGTSLNWLTTGHGSKQASANTNTIEVEKYLLSDGALQKDGFYIFISSNANQQCLVFIRSHLGALIQLVNQLVQRKCSMQILLDHRFHVVVMISC